MTRALLLLFLLVLVTPARGEERFALLIGANAGWADDRPLRYAESDAHRVRDVLVELGGFPEERIQLLREPDTAQVREALRRLAESVKALGAQESLVVIYYSGHADEQHLHLRGTPLSHAELYEALRDLPATVRLGVLDACRSGSILAAKGGRRTSPFEVRVVNELGGRGLALLTSSGADELSQEARALAGSVFTHHWVSGLRGAGDFDQDGAVTLSEAYRHAFQRTEADTAATGTPHRPAFHFELAGQGEPVLTRPLQGAARLLLPHTDGERYVVVDEYQVRLVAEGYSRKEEQVALALAPGTYHVTHVQGERLAVATISVERGTRVEAHGLAYAHRPLSQGLLKGNPDELDVEDLREWRRGEALRLLDAGDPQASLRLFDQLLVQQPDDVGALRGRVRALVRLADQHARQGDRAQERKALRDALNAEPTLAEDLDFVERYRWLREQEAATARTERVRESVNQEIELNPYVLRRWGVGFDLMSTRGLLAPWVTVILDEVWLPYVALDFMGRGVDLGIRYKPENRDPGFDVVYGVGTHLSLTPLGVPPIAPLDSPNPLSIQFMWGNTLHIDTGILYIGRPGASVELGLGLSLYSYPPKQAFGLMPWASMSVGWFFL